MPKSKIRINNPTYYPRSTTKAVKTIGTLDNLLSYDTKSKIKVKLTSLKGKFKLEVPKSKKYLCPICNKPVVAEYAVHSECQLPVMKCVSPQPQKYQCWKCEGKKTVWTNSFIDINASGERYVNRVYEKCPNCNGKGYIELIPIE